MLLHYGCRNTSRRVNETRRSILSLDRNADVVRMRNLPVALCVAEAIAELRYERQTSGAHPRSRSEIELILVVVASRVTEAASHVRAPVS